ncbi:MAG TPA: hypothetical protein VGN74_05410 [Brevundimonas sp.]|jgi:hypothetical protein|uniref:hypothetical protein n=1 Tax=Brevundimonas sp. TaxID=1871086 RepID=UPI002E10E7BA|nr:hypothetical protein [Brevundimonas sp.]
MSGWHISDVSDPETGALLVCGGEGESYGLVASVTTPEHARLISAAPDLLEALKNLSDAYEALCEMAEKDFHRQAHSHYAKARAAISRATGATDE